MFYLKIHLYFILTIGLLSACTAPKSPENPKIIHYQVDPSATELRFFLKDEVGTYFHSFEKLKTWLEKKGKTLSFAMNGGMFHAGGKPVGLYIETGKEINPINRDKKGYGNFFLQPNGIFYITKDKKANICTTSTFQKQEEIQYATQSGPMLLIDGNISKLFTKDSPNLQLRNGVGILPDGRLIFAMSKEKINLYSFANFFKNQGCIQALYLDGYVSKTYLPAQNEMDLGGNFGVIVAEIR